MFVRAVFLALGLVATNANAEISVFGISHDSYARIQTGQQDLAHSNDFGAFFATDVITTGNDAVRSRATLNSNVFVGASSFTVQVAATATTSDRNPEGSGGGSSNARSTVAFTTTRAFTYSITGSVSGTVGQAQAGVGSAKLMRYNSASGTFQTVFLLVSGYRNDPDEPEGQAQINGTQSIYLPAGYYIFAAAASQFGPLGGGSYGTEGQASCSVALRVTETSESVLQAEVVPSITGDRKAHEAAIFFQGYPNIPYVLERSTDGGQTWTQVGSPQANVYGRFIFYEPFYPGQTTLYRIRAY